MKFTVTWSPSAMDRVTQWWIDRQSDRPAITRATDQIDVLLANDPFRSVLARGV